MNSSNVSSASQSQSFKERVIKGVIWGQIGKLFEAGLSLVFTILVVRQLGPGDYGQYGLISSVATVGLLLTGLGVNEILGSQIPKLLAEGKSLAARHLVLQILSLRLGLLGLVVIALIILHNFFAVVFKTPDFNGALVWICLLLLFSGFGELLQVLFTALLDMQFVTLNRVLGMGLSLGLAVGLFAWQGPSVQGALIAAVLGWVTVILLALFRLSRRISNWWEGSAETPQVIRYGLTVWSGNLLNFGLSIYSSTFLLGILTSDTRQVGFYNAAVLPIGRIWAILVAGMATTMLPTLAEAGSRQGMAGSARVWRAYVSLFVMLLLPAYSFLIVYADPLIRFLFGEAYAPAANLMQIYLGLALLGIPFAGTVTINLFYATRKQGLVLTTSAFGGLLDIGLLLFLIPKFNALGAILADGLAGLATSLFLFVLLKRNLPILRYPLGFVFKIAGATLAAFVTAYLLVPPHEIVTTIFSMMLGGAFFLGLCWLLKPLAGLNLPLNMLGPQVVWVARWFGQPSESTF